MLSNRFRPWGEISWVFKNLVRNKWNFLGCPSTEDRCLGAMRFGLTAGLLNSCSFIEVLDPNHEQDTELSSKLEANRNLIKTECKTISAYDSMELLSTDEEIFNAGNEFIDQQSGNVIFDISSFPKRFFFPFVKLLLQSDKVTNLVITYSEPSEYDKSDLSDDPEPWYPLPLFMPTDHPEPKFDFAIVGTGFMPFSLPKLLKDKHSEIALRLFFPFPPGPPNYQRAWEFVRKIEKYYTFKDRDKIIRVNSLDVNGAFNYMFNITEQGVQRCMFAPYGPKPISLAICLFATLFNSPVYYTQPKYYNPNYSKGLKRTLAYCIKLDGKDLFK